MNTVKIGDSLENRAFDLIKKLLSDKKLMIIPETSRVYQKKKYYSEKRKGDIKFDIAIESYPSTDANKYSLLILIECKNYKSKVTVKDVQKFESDISQVGEHNTKGIMITSCPFQKNALNLAKSFGIGVIRLDVDESYQWTTYRRDRQYSPDANEYESAFTGENNPFGVIACYKHQIFEDIAELLAQYEIIRPQKKKSKYLEVPFRDDQYMTTVVADLFKYGIYDDRTLNFDKLIKVLEDKYQVTFDFSTVLPNGILGQIEFSPLRILISKELDQNLGRYRYTLAHEIAHLLLHKNILEQYKETQTITASALSFNNSISEIATNRLEVQANKMASHLLMPTEFFKEVVNEFFEKEGIRYNYLYLDHQPVNRATARMLFTLLQCEFMVSKEVALIRLRESKLLKEGPKGPKEFSNIGEIFSSLLTDIG